MRRKFRRALKNLKQVYHFPNPTHENAFFQKSTEEMKKKHPFFYSWKIRQGAFQMSVVCTVVIIMVGGYGVYQNYKNDRSDIFIEESNASTEPDVSHSMEKETQPVSSTIPKISSPFFTSVSRESGTSAGNKNVTNSTQTVTTATHNPTEVYPTEGTQTNQQPVSATVTNEPPSTMQTVSATQTVAVTTGTNTVKTTAKTTTKPTVSSTIIPPPPQPENEGKDYRVTPAYQYQKTDAILTYLDLVQLGFDDALQNYHPNYHPNDSTTSFFSWENCADLSDSIVSGTVISLTYTREENILWTQVDMEVTAVYKGTLHPGDKISVYELGGYIPLTEFLALYPECTSKLNMTAEEMQYLSYFDSGLQITSPVIGESCLYFLKEGMGNIPAGAYTYAGNADDSRYHKDSDHLWNVLYENITLSMEELIAYLCDEES